MLQARDRCIPDSPGWQTISIGMINDCDAVRISWCALIIARHCGLITGIHRNNLWPRLQLSENSPDVWQIWDQHWFEILDHCKNYQALRILPSDHHLPPHSRLLHMINIYAQIWLESCNYSFCMRVVDQPRYHHKLHYINFLIIVVDPSNAKWCQQTRSTQFPSWQQLERASERADACHVSEKLWSMSKFDRHSW